MNEIKVGQKLYHFAYGPLTVVAVSDRYVDTTDDFPGGFRQKVDFNIPLPEGGYRPYSKASKQTWIRDSVGHWLFERPEDIGKENNNWAWEKIWPHLDHEPVDPVSQIKYKTNWHQWYFDNGYADIKDLVQNNGTEKKVGVITDVDTTGSGKKVGKITDVDTIGSGKKVGKITDADAKDSNSKVGVITDANTSDNKVAAESEKKVGRITAAE